jgi:type II secretory pathway component PulM
MHYKEIALRHLSNPMKLRLVTIFLITAIGIGGVYYPLSKRIQEAQKKLDTERNRNNKIQDMENLINSAELYRSRISDSSDTNEWAQYILDGLPNFKVKLRGMESGEPKRVGPYNAVSISIEIEGAFEQLREIVEWFEKSQRMLRIDSMRFEKRPDSLLMKLIVLGLVPKNARKT